MTAHAHFGEMLALATALVWASAVILFKKSGETASPLGLNLFKNLLAFLLVLPTMAVMGVEPLRAAPPGDYALLVLSGVLGIGIADTLFFKSLNLLGAARSAVVDCLYSPVIILLSMLWLGERITAVQAAGVALIVSAVLALGGEKGAARITRRQLSAGIALGALSMAAMGVGIVMIKPLLERSPILWAVEVRFAGAAVFGSATALMNLFFYLAIDRIDLGKGVAIEFIGPIAVAAAATRTARNAGALVLAVAGVVTLGGTELGDNTLGVVFILLASTMWAAYIVVGSHVARLRSGVAGLGVGLAIGTLVITPVGAPGSGHVWASAGLLVLCCATGVFSNAIGYGIDQHVLRRIPIRRFSVLLALLPVTALAVGWIALGQRPEAIDLVGTALVLAGVVLQEREEIPRTEPSSAPY